MISFCIRMMLQNTKLEFYKKNVQFIILYNIQTTTVRRMK